MSSNVSCDERTGRFLKCEWTCTNWGKYQWVDTQIVDIVSRNVTDSWYRNVTAWLTDLSLQHLAGFPLVSMASGWRTWALIWVLPLTLITARCICRRMGTRTVRSRTRSTWQKKRRRSYLPGERARGWQRQGYRLFWDCLIRTFYKDIYFVSICYDFLCRFWSMSFY